MISRESTVLTLLLTAAAAGAASSVKGPVRAFEVTASRFQFEPGTLEVQEGDTVRIMLRSADGTHGVAIKEFKVKARIPKGGESVTVEFVANKAGRFEFACSEYCGPGHRDMKGELVVAPRATQ